MQEVGLKKWDFSEARVTKMSKELRPPLKGLYGKDHFGEPAEIKGPMEEHNDIQEESQAPENDEFDEEFGILNIIN